MSKRSRSKASIPINRESLFWILSPVFCLLPHPPVLPSLPNIHESIMQNKANFPNDRANASTVVAKVYTNKPLLATRKKQTQSNPILSRRSPERSRIPPPSILSTATPLRRPPDQRHLPGRCGRYPHAGTTLLCASSRKNHRSL